MGMDSSELLKFFEEFPQGSETLILRIIHILTEKSKYLKFSIRKSYVNKFRFFLNV